MNSSRNPHIFSRNQCRLVYRGWDCSSRSSETLGWYKKVPSRFCGIVTMLAYFCYHPSESDGGNRFPCFFLYHLFCSGQRVRMVIGLCRRAVLAAHDKLVFNRIVVGCLLHLECKPSQPPVAVHTLHIKTYTSDTFSYTQVLSIELPTCLNSCKGLGWYWDGISDPGKKYRG